MINPNNYFFLKEGLIILQEVEFIAGVVFRSLLLNYKFYMEETKKEETEDPEKVLNIFNQKKKKSYFFFGQIVFVVSYRTYYSLVFI